jgi:hypothetical protein
MHSKGKLCAFNDKQDIRINVKPSESVICFFAQIFSFAFSISAEHCVHQLVCDVMFR